MSLGIRKIFDSKVANSLVQRNKLFFQSLENKQSIHFYENTRTFIKVIKIDTFPTCIEYSETYIIIRTVRKPYTKFCCHIQDITSLF
jgi:hypothetical protein